MPFRFFLQNKAGDYYYVNNSIVGTTTDQHWIRFTPDGWAASEMKWIRNLDYAGVFRAITSPYDFVNDGATIIRHIKETQGFDGFCKIRIDILDDFDPTLWKLWFVGNIDFLTFFGSYSSARVALVEGGIKSYFDANAGTPYEILLDTDALTINHDGIRLDGNNTYVPIRSSFGINSQTTDVDYIITNAWVSQEGDYPVSTHKNQILQGVYTQGAAMPDGAFENYMYQATQNQSIQLEFHQKISLVGANNSTFRIILLTVGSDKAIKLKNVVFSQVVPNGGFPIDYQVDFTTGTFNVASGDRVYLIYGGTSSSGQVLVTFINYGNDPDSLAYNHKIITTFRMPATTTKAYRYVDLFKKLVAKMTEGNFTGKSDYLSNPASFAIDSYPYRATLTSGDGLRQFANAKIKTSLDELYDCGNGIWSMGMGIENDQIVFENIRYFFNKDLIIADLGEVSGFTHEPAKEYLANTLKNGYNDQTYDGLNGRDETNTMHQYKYPVTAIKQEQNLLSPIRTDVYGIEQVRANLTNKKTTDSDSDNDTFLIEIEAAPVSGSTYNIYRPAGTITGIKHPDTKYNIPLSPARNFIRNGAIIHAILDGKDGSVTTFQTSEKNQDLVSNLGSGTIAEKQNFTIDASWPKLFKPILFKFEAISPNSLMELMAANPRGCFRFKWMGNFYKGYPMEVGVFPANHQTYNFTLLCTEDTDTSKLVY